MKSQETASSAKDAETEQKSECGHELQATVQVQVLLILLISIVVQYSH